jgi:DDE family transposase
MDGKLWATVYQTVMQIDHPKPSSRATYSDQDIVLVTLRASYDQQSISWACRPENWEGLDGPKQLPSQPTVSRRSRTPQVQSLLDAIEAWLRLSVPDTDRVLAVDGRALLISPFSKDPDARWGHAIKGFGFGFKLHAIWGGGAVPLAWSVQPLNRQESVTAASCLAPRLPVSSRKRYLVGDAAYDTNRLHAAAAAKGFQLLSPPKRPGKSVGHRPHEPARLEGLRLLRTAYGQWLYRQRGKIERQFGNATMRAEGLGSLPAHVRRLTRVRRYVHAKLILNGFRILTNRQLPLAPAA